MPVINCVEINGGIVPKLYARQHGIPFLAPVPWAPLEDDDDPIVDNQYIDITQNEDWYRGPFGKGEIEVRCVLSMGAASC